MKSYPDVLNVSAMAAILVFSLAPVHAQAASAASNGASTAPNAAYNAGTAATPNAAYNATTAATPNAAYNSETANTPNAAYNAGTANTPNAAYNARTAATPNASYGAGTVNPAIATPTNPTNAMPNNNNNVGNRTPANWTTENQYWESHFSTRPYWTSSATYSSYEPAYQYGVNLFNQNGGQPYSSLTQAQLQAGWAQAHGGSTLGWSQAQAATEDAYMKLYDSRNNPSGSNPTSN